MSPELAIIGAGVMAEAIARGIISGGKFQPTQIIAADVSPQRRELFQSSLKIQAVETAAEAVAGAKIVLLCVKPYQMQDVLGQIAGNLGPDALVISIAAGTSTAFIESTLGGKPRRIVRAMPNTPMLVGAGMVAIAKGPNAKPEDLPSAKALFESSAKVIGVTEDKIDAVTAVSGSGPAYFFFLTEQMIKAGIEMGLAPEEARILAIQTAVGAAKIMGTSDENPADQRKLVTTPNGTTHAAITHMESQNWPQITIDALKAAEKRSRELGR